MKINIAIISLFFMFSCKKENSRTEHPDSKDSLISVRTKGDVITDTISSVEDVKEEYTRLHILMETKKLDSSSFDYECEERAGTVVFYSEKGNLKVIQHSYGENSHFSAVENYFIRNNKPFFIFNQETVWNFDGGTPEKPETKDEIKEYRYYYVNGRLESCRNKEYSIRSSSESNPKPEDISAVESKSCSDTELQKTFKLLMKNKTKKGQIKCL